MKPLSMMTATVAKGLTALFVDIDDTLTTDGKLTGEAYGALWRLREAGVSAVPVTGRPAGWCDLIVRQWPVEGVIGENGALAFFESDGVLHRFYHPEVASGTVRARLDEVRRVVLDEIPQSRVAKDQFCRLFDLAIDFREEAPDLGWDTAQEIAKIFHRMGAIAKVSSIHVNGWFGSYDKLAMVKQFSKERWGLSLDEHRNQFVFCGDSPNDEPLFAYFPNACGVANVRDLADSMRSLPAYVTPSRCGKGFCELVEHILRLR